MQVTNNNINTLSQGILLGSNFFLDLPYAYGNNVNNTFSNNQITNCQISPLTLESALTVSMAGNTFTDVMCNVFGELLHPAPVSLAWLPHESQYTADALAGRIVAGPCKDRLILPDSIQKPHSDPATCSMWCSFKPRLTNAKVCGTPQQS